MPRGGRVEVDFTGTETKALSVQQLIADHRRCNRSGEFNVQTIGQLLVVTPAQGGPLDTPVPLARKDCTLDELLRELTRSLTQLNPVAVHEPGMLVGGSQRFAFSASNEPARSVLARALQAASSRYAAPGLCLGSALRPELRVISTPQSRWSRCRTEVRS